MASDPKHKLEHKVNNLADLATPTHVITKTAILYFLSRAARVVTPVPYHYLLLHSDIVDSSHQNGSEEGADTGGES